VGAPERLRTMISEARSFKDTYAEVPSRAASTAISVLYTYSLNLFSLGIVLLFSLQCMYAFRLFL